MGDKDQQVKTGKPEEKNMATLHLIVFKVGTEEFGIRIEQVKEVNLTPDIARVPRAPQFIKGVANIRGDIIAIMDMEERFGISPEEQAPSALPGITYTLVIETEDYTIGLLVRNVPQSLTISQSIIDKTPSLLQSINLADSFIEGIAKLANRLIVILDMEKILSMEEIELLPS